MNLVQPLLAIDQFFNCFWYIKGDGWGWADEAISARAYRCYREGLISDIPKRIIDGIFFLQREHCFQAWLAEFERRQLPSSYKVEIPSGEFNVSKLQSCQYC